MDQAKKLFVPICKVDVEKREVTGIATAELPDRDGEICDYASTKPLFEAWSAGQEKASGGKSKGNLRAMHSNIAAGKLSDIAYDDKAKEIRITAKVVDDREWQKVLDGVYTGFSQGGRYVARWSDDATGMTRYTAEPIEVSLVDVPALPAATFEVVKADGASEKRSFKTYLTGDDDPSIKVSLLRKVAEALGFIKSGNGDAPRTVTTNDGDPAPAKAGDAPGEGDKPYGDVAYADPGYQDDKKKRYPLDTEEHIRAAWSYIAKPKNQKPYTSGQVDQIKAKIVAAWKEKIDKDGPPSADEKMAAWSSLEKCCGPAFGSNSEIFDAAQAIEALRMVVALRQWEASEEDNEDSQVADLDEAIARLKSFIASEILEDDTGKAAGFAALGAVAKLIGADAATIAKFQSDPAADTGGTSADEIDTMFLNLTEKYQMTTLSELLGKRAPTGANKSAHSEGMAHLEEVGKCHKAAHEFMGKALEAHLAALGASKAADINVDKMHEALAQMHKCHGEITKATAHHALAKAAFAKAAGQEGGEGAEPAGSAAPVSPPPGGGNDPTNPLKGVFTQEMVDQLVKATAEAAAAKAENELLKRMPIGAPRARVFEIDKNFTAAAASGADAGQAEAVQALYKGVNPQPRDGREAEDAVKTMLRNMFDNPRHFERNVAGDSKFRGHARLGSRAA